MYGYDRGFQRSARRGRYDMGYERVDGRSGRAGRGHRRSPERFPRDRWHDTSGFDRALRGGAWGWHPGPGVTRYERAPRRRFQRPPEGAELREFRPGEMGPLWDR